LHSHYDFSYVSKLPIKQITKLLNHAIAKDQEQASWDLWKEMYPWMAAGWIKSVSFSDFKNETINKPQKYTQKTNDEIVTEMTAIVQAYKGR
jgi:hypothetical protein